MMWVSSCMGLLSSLLTLPMLTFLLIVRNKPEETEYFLHRLHAPWIYIVMLAPVFSFLFRCMQLIPKAAKWT